MNRHLLSSADLTRDDVRMLLATAAEMHEVQHRDVKKLPTLRGRTVINLFFEDSTRTRSSFEIAGKWMSADTINITGKGSSASKGESLRDTVRTIDAMSVDALVIRHMASGAAHQVSQWVDASVINAGDGTHEHPTQALLDAYTIEQRLGDLDGARVAIVGDLTHSRVFRSNAITLRTLGAHVTLVAPPTLMPSGIGAWAAADGLELTDDLDAVLASGPDAVMMLRVQRERMSGGFFPTAREYTVGFGLTRERAMSPSSASSSPASALLTAPTGWTSTRPAVRPRSRTRSAASAVSVTGLVLAIASTAVKPPTAAAADPEPIVSASSRPGSRRWVWRSTRPGSATRPSASRTSAPLAERRAPTSVITPSSMRRSWRPLPARSAPVISSALTGSSLLLRAGGRGPTSARPPPRRPARG